MNDSARPETASPSRRQVTTAAVWAVPTLALAVATPAGASSTIAAQPPGLQGWISFTHIDNSTGRFKVQGYNSGAHAYGSYGLWVTNTTAKSTITNIRIYLHYRPGGMAWSGNEGGPGWSSLVRDGSTVIDGVSHETYRMDYLLAPSPSENVTRLQNDMKFESDSISISGRTSHYIDRYVVVDGVELAFRRGRDQTDYTPLNSNTPPNLPPNPPAGRGLRFGSVIPEGAEPVDIDPASAPS